MEISLKRLYDVGAVAGVLLIVSGAVGVLYGAAHLVERPAAAAVGSAVTPRLPAGPKAPAGLAARGALDVTADGALPSELMASRSQPETCRAQNYAAFGKKRPTVSDARSVELTFDFGSADIDTNAASEVLSPVVESALATDCRRLIVDGHADGVGDYHHNMYLSWRRAMATMDWLADRGIDRDRIVLRSFGAHQPKPTAGVEAQRRVEVRLLTCSEGKSS